MRFLPVFLMRILKAAARREDAGGKMTIVVRPPYAYLQEELHDAFEGQSDVHVVVDRRSRERRAASEPVTVERRQSDRRGSTEEIVQVVISG